MSCGVTLHINTVGPPGCCWPSCRPFHPRGPCQCVTLHQKCYMVSWVKQASVHSSQEPLMKRGCFYCSVAESCLDSMPPWTAAHQAPLSFTVSQSLLRCMSIELVMPSNHLILCRHEQLFPRAQRSLSGVGLAFSCHLGRGNMKPPLVNPRLGP